MTLKPSQSKVLHFVGIGGIGMSGIAEVFLNQGYRVTGSDLSEGESTKRLKTLGAQIQVGHAARNIGDASVVVISSAVRSDNPEVVEAKKRRIPVIPRAEMLGELMRGKIGIAVAGTHGKTTTTSLMASVLMAADMDPTAIIGGRVNALGTNAKLGKSPYVVAEADESDGSFIHLPATYAIITNIDDDHLDFFKTQDAIDHAFTQLVAELPFYGLAAVCGEDAGVRRCLSSFLKPYRTYGLSKEFDCNADHIRNHGIGTRFNVNLGKTKLGEITLPIPGRHNVLNALACILVGLEMGIPFSKIAEGIASFSGVKRRFEVRWKDEASRRYLVDDYGHHPTEITATLAAAKAFWTGRVISVFQPHRYTRTVACKEGFKNAFRQSDLVYVTDLYAAGEEPISGIDSRWLVDQMKSVSYEGQRIEHSGTLDQTLPLVHQEMRDGDLVICFGAGNITRLSDALVERLGEPS